MQAVARLWGELAEFPASRPDAALAHGLRELARIVGANNAFWVGAVREPDPAPEDGLAGWRPRAMGFLTFEQEYQDRVAALLKRLRADEIDPMVQAIVARSGRTRAALRSELVEDTVWRDSYLYNEVLRPVRIEDRIVGAHTVDQHRESYVGLDRAPTDRPFGDRERDVLRLFLDGSPTWHRELLRSHGLLGARAALRPREREVLQLLLSDKSEREIAEKLGLSASTTRQYIVTVLRAFAVKRRVELMGRWLRE